MTETSSTAIFEAPETDQLALLFPAYDIHALVACGGMGAVYQATQRSLARDVAIKILPREFSADESFRVGFQEEAKAMARLNHPNLIGVYDFGEVDGMLYIVMEYVAGKSLYHSVNGHALDQADALRLLIDVCAGLDHAHEHGILHRDIKPANILLDQQARPKIGDFGLARPRDSKVQEGEQIFGTPGYTAPEVLEPPFTFDHRADIFSVGVMLHELLTGMLPEADPRPASHICACSPRLDAVIHKATHPDPDSRYPSASAMATELESIASSPSRALLTAGSAAAAGRLYVPPKPAKKSSSGLGFLVLLLVAAAAVAVVATNRETSSVTTAPVPEQTEPRERVIEPPPHSGEHTEAAASPTSASATATAGAGATPGSDETAAATSEPMDTPAASAPVFDVPGFFEKAHGIMRQRLTPAIENQNKELVSNIGSFVSGLEREVRKLPRAERLPAQDLLAEEAHGWKSDGHLIPESLPPDLAAMPWSEQLHSEYLGKQRGIQEKLTREIHAENSVYIIGIENQIKRLEGTGDQAAMDLLREEIALCKADPEHFRAHVLK